MTLIKDILSGISTCKEQYALYGGHAANRYREKPREVRELSIALALGSAKKSKKKAEQILKDLGLTTSYKWIEGLQSKTGKAVSIVIGTPQEGSPILPVQFFLPSLPWVSKGVRRAQGSEVEVDGAKLPVIPIDDLIIAKAHALTLFPKSGIDIDDLQSIFQGAAEIDIPYVMGEFNLLELTLPAALQTTAPKELQRYIC